MLGHTLTGVTILSLVTSALSNPQSPYTRPAKTCKTLPADIPASTWASLNQTVSGALISTAAYGVPGGTCYQGQPNYNATACETVQSQWFNTWALSTDHPAHNAYQNWNHDACWPFNQNGLKCTPLLGYPTYVINASTAAHVVAGINFARANNVRLIVKSSGHDFRGRSVGPNSLSIWVHHLKGTTWSDAWTPTGNCGAAAWRGKPTVTWAAGENSGSKFALANAHGHQVTVGGASSVSGGFAMGGGHSVLSPTYGLASDNVVEVSLVAPDGSLLTANECQNADLFWAVRGGGGGTFGVVLNITEKAHPATILTTTSVDIVARDKANSTLFWNAAAAWYGVYPQLGDLSMMSYGNVADGSLLGGASYNAVFFGINRTVDDSKAIFEPPLADLNATFGGAVTVATSYTSYKTFYDFWSTTLDDFGSPGTPVGIDLVAGSRLLDRAALVNKDLPRLLKRAATPGGLQTYLVSGKGVHQYAGDFNSVQPSWRTSYVHALTGAAWIEGNATMFGEQLPLLNSSQGALIDLAPNTGSYQNEGNSFEPNFQQSFFGSNYPRLVSIKKKVDPNHVFWCLSCVNSEGLSEVNGQLCYN